MTGDIFPLYIGGRLVSAEAAVDVVNPANDEIVGRVAVASADAIGAALEAAAAAFPSWSALGGPARADWMDRLRAAIADREEWLRTLVHQEMGKPWAAAGEDYAMLLDSLDYYAGLARQLDGEEIADLDGTHRHEILREPVGVVGAFLAWNFPLLNLAYKLGPAMASGCPIVIKPSAKTPLSAYAVGQLCHEIGLPAGVVNIVGGDDAMIGNRISASPIPAMLTLIGSTATGVHVMRTGATSIKRYSMELGGNAPVLVFADADLDLAADVITALKFGNSGQICVAPNRVYADADIRDELAQKIVDRARTVVVGFDRTAPIGMGPLIDRGARDRIEALVADAMAGGAELLVGGSAPADCKVGAFLAPTVLGQVSSDMRIAREEVFGPVVNLMESPGDEKAMIAAANDTDAGLTAYVFTADGARARRCAQALRFGEVQVNGVKYAINLPHGGLKQSGIGVDCSHLALDDYFAVKRISTALAPEATA